MSNVAARNRHGGRVTGLGPKTNDPNRHEPRAIKSAFPAVETAMLCVLNPVDSRTLSNLVIDYVSFRLRSRQSNALGMNAYMNSLRTSRTVRVVEKLLGCIHRHCLTKYGTPAGCPDVNAARFLSAFFFADRVTAAGHAPAAVRAHEMACLLLDTFSAIVARLRWLGSSATMEALSDDLTAPFLTQYVEFFKALEAFEGVNQELIITRIEHALAALYQMRSTYVEGDAVPAWLAECDDKIGQLHARLLLCAGLDAVDNLHARLAQAVMRL